MFFYSVMEQQGSQVILKALSLGVGGVKGRVASSEGVVG